MTPGLTRLFDLAPSELVAVVGAGGKTTLLLSLAAELSDAGHRVAVTTTTKMGSAQVLPAASVCHSPEPGEVADAVASCGLVFVVGTDDGSKITGPPPTAIDRLYRSGVVDYVLVEADGARRKPFKAPADHEPVIPKATTVVVVVMGTDAIGGTIAEVCHRPERVAAIAGRSTSGVLDVDACVAVLGSPDGGLKGVPEAARVVVALTKVTDERAPGAAAIADRLGGHARIDGVVAVESAADQLAVVVKPDRIGSE